MAAYVITDVEITNAELYGEFLEKVTATVEGHGGKFVVRGGALEVVLGDWAPPRLAILQFDSVEQVKVWLSSPDYTALDDIRAPAQQKSIWSLWMACNAVSARHSLDTSSLELGPSRLHSLF